MATKGSEVMLWHLPLGGHMDFEEDKDVQQQHSLPGPYPKPKALLPSLLTLGADPQLYANSPGNWWSHGWVEVPVRSHILQSFLSQIDVT